MVEKQVPVQSRLQTFFGHCSLVQIDCGSFFYRPSIACLSKPVGRPVAIEGCSLNGPINRRITRRPSPLTILFEGLRGL